MNRIITDEQVYLENFEGEIEVTKKESLLHLKGVNKITKFQTVKDGKITFHLQDDAKLIFIDYWTKQNSNIECQIISENQTECQWQLFLEAETDFDIILKNKIVGSQNKTNIQVHIVTDEMGKVKMESTGYIASHTMNNEFIEELKGLMLGTQPITFLPNLIVDSDNVEANHNATIKCIDEQELFYLQSKGLTKELAIDLIKNGFLNKFS